MNRLWFLAVLFGIASGCSQAPTTPSKFNVPPLIGLNYDETTAQLGKATDTEIVTEKNGASRMATWDSLNGDSLTFFYDPMSKKPSSVIFTIPDKDASPDKNKVLVAGGISIDDPAYKVDFLKIGKGQINGVQLTPLRTTP